MSLHTPSPELEIDPGFEEAPISPDRTGDASDEAAMLRAVVQAQAQQLQAIRWASMQQRAALAYGLQQRQAMLALQQAQQSQQPQRAENGDAEEGGEEAANEGRGGEQAVDRTTADGPAAAAGDSHSTAGEEGLRGKAVGAGPPASDSQPAEADLGDHKQTGTTAAGQAPDEGQKEDTQAVDVAGSPSLGAAGSPSADAEATARGGDNSDAAADEYGSDGDGFEDAPADAAADEYGSDGDGFEDAPADAAADEYGSDDDGFEDAPAEGVEGELGERQLVEGDNNNAFDGKEEDEEMDPAAPLTDAQVVTLRRQQLEERARRQFRRETGEWPEGEEEDEEGMLPPSPVLRPGTGGVQYAGPWTTLRPLQDAGEGDDHPGEDDVEFHSDGDWEDAPRREAAVDSVTASILDSANRLIRRARQEGERDARVLLRDSSRAAAGKKGGKKAKGKKGKKGKKKPKAPARGDGSGSDEDDEAARASGGRRRRPRSRGHSGRKGSKKKTSSSKRRPRSGGSTARSPRKPSAAAVARARDRALMDRVLVEKIRPTQKAPPPTGAPPGQVPGTSSVMGNALVAVELEDHSWEGQDPLDGARLHLEPPGQGLADRAHAAAQRFEQRHGQPQREQQRHQAEEEAAAGEREGATARPASAGTNLLTQVGPVHLGGPDALPSVIPVSKGTAKREGISKRNIHRVERGIASRVQASLDRRAVEEARWDRRVRDGAPEAYKGGNLSGQLLRPREGRVEGMIKAAREDRVAPVDGAADDFAITVPQQGPVDIVEERGARAAGAGPKLSPRSERRQQRRAMREHEDRVRLRETDDSQLPGHVHPSGARIVDASHTINSELGGTEPAKETPVQRLQRRRRAEGEPADKLGQSSALIRKRAAAAAAELGGGGDEASHSHQARRKKAGKKKQKKKQQKKNGEGEGKQRSAAGHQSAAGGSVAVGDNQATADDLMPADLQAILGAGAARRLDEQQQEQQLGHQEQQSGGDLSLVPLDDGPAFQPRESQLALGSTGPSAADGRAQLAPNGGSGEEQKDTPRVRLADHEEPDYGASMATASAPEESQLAVGSSVDPYTVGAVEARMAQHVVDRDVWENEVARNILALYRAASTQTDAKGRLLDQGMWEEGHSAAAVDAAAADAGSDMASGVRGGPRSMSEADAQVSRMVVDGEMARGIAGMAAPDNARRKRTRSKGKRKRSGKRKPAAQAAGAGAGVASAGRAAGGTGKRPKRTQKDGTLAQRGVVTIWYGGGGESVSSRCDWRGLAAVMQASAGPDDEKFTDDRVAQLLGSLEREGQYARAVELVSTALIPRLRDPDRDRSKRQWLAEASELEAKAQAVEEGRAPPPSAAASGGSGGGGGGGGGGGEGKDADVGSEIEQMRERAAQMRRQYPAQDTIGNLWRQLLVASQVFGVKLVEEGRLPPAMRVLQRCAELTAMDRLTPTALRKELNGHIEDSFSLYYFKRKKNQAALQAASKATKCHASTGDFERVAISHLHTSAILSRLGKHGEAVRCLARVLQLVDEGKMEGGDGPSARRISMLAVVYHNIAVEHLIVGAAEEACMASQNARRLARLSLSFASKYLKNLEATHTASLELLQSSTVVRALTMNDPLQRKLFRNLSAALYA